MLLTLLLACSDPAPPLEAPAPAPSRPDIVLVVVDTLRADHLSAYGHSRPTSPNLDALAKGGALYSRAYAQSGWTLASFASLLTGRLPHEHLAVRDSAHPEVFGVLQPEVQTLAEALQAAGYATGAVVNNAFLAPEFKLNQGFESYNWEGAWQSRHRTAAATVTEGITWLNAQTKPAFLMLHMMEPHMSYIPPGDVRGTFSPRDNPPIPFPFLPDSAELDAWMTGRYQPPEAVKAYMGQLYDEEILTVDRAIGQLVSALQARPRWEQTALIVTADHGEEHWDHGGFEHGTTLYGELTRVPLIAAGAVPARGEIQTIVQHLDLFQGLLALAGAAPPKDSRGANLWTLGGAQGRVALSEGTLYGGDAVSIVDHDARLYIDLTSGEAEAWAVDPRGGESRPLKGAERDQAAARLLPVLKRLRPDMSPLKVAAGTTVTDITALEQLRSLGYIGGPEDAP